MLKRQKQAFSWGLLTNQPCGTTEPQVPSDRPCLKNNITRYREWYQGCLLASTHVQIRPPFQYMNTNTQLSTHMKKLNAKRIYSPNTEFLIETTHWIANRALQFPQVLVTWASGGQRVKFRGDSLGGSWAWVWSLEKRKSWRQDPGRGLRVMGRTSWAEGRRMASCRHWLSHMEKNRALSGRYEEALKGEDMKRHWKLWTAASFRPRGRSDHDHMLTLFKPVPPSQRACTSIWLTLPAGHPLSACLSWWPIHLQLSTGKGHSLLE